MQALTAEIVGLLNEQAFYAGAAHTEREICESFSNILLRHWNLCSVAIFLRGDDGRLQPCTNFNHEHVADDCARHIGEAMAAEIERAGREFRVGVEGEAEGGAALELRAEFERAGLKAGVAVPIRANGETAGALVVASRDAERLRSSLAGGGNERPAVVNAAGQCGRGDREREPPRGIETLL